MFIRGFFRWHVHRKGIDFFFVAPGGPPNLFCIAHFVMLTQTLGILCNGFARGLQL
jgi:hypothetical protein